MRYFKFLDRYGYGSLGRFGYQDYFPKKRRDGTWVPGKWLPAVKGEVMICDNGYHYCNSTSLSQWLSFNLYEIARKGDTIDGGDIVVSRSIRLVNKVETWNVRAQRLFALWCARDALAAVKETSCYSKCSFASLFAEACEVLEQHLDGKVSEDTYYDIKERCRIAFPRHVYSDMHAPVYAVASAMALEEIALLSAFISVKCALLLHTFIDSEAASASEHKATTLTLLAARGVPLERRRETVAPLRRQLIAMDSAKLVEMLEL